MSVEEIYRVTKIDRWFPRNIEDIVQMEDFASACPRPEAADDDLIWDAKQQGFSDRQLGHLWHTTEAEVRRVRKRAASRPCSSLSTPRRRVRGLSRPTIARGRMSGLAGR
ncbi:MAG: hypothetical protein U0793_13185 [Gemmataceae bacterium]